MKNSKKFDWSIVVGIIYSPIYIIGWLLHKISRFLLAIAYFLMLRPVNAMGILSNFFKIADTYDYRK